MNTVFKEDLPLPISISTGMENRGGKAELEGDISNNWIPSLVLVSMGRRESPPLSFFEEEVPVFGNHVFSDFDR